MATDKARLSTRLDLIRPTGFLMGKWVVAPVTGPPASVSKSRKLIVAQPLFTFPIAALGIILLCVTLNLWEGEVPPEVARGRTIIMVLVFGHTRTSRFPIVTLTRP